MLEQKFRAVCSTFLHSISFITFKVNLWQKFLNQEFVEMLMEKEEEEEEEIRRRESQKMSIDKWVQI